MLQIKKVILKNKIVIKKLITLNKQFSIKKPKKHKQKQKIKHTNWFRAFRWDLFKFDFTKFLGRSYYFIKFIFFVLLDLAICFSIKYTFWIILLLIVPLGILSLNSFREVMEDIYYRAKCQQHKDSLKNVPRVGFATGGPGTGKTSSKVYEDVEKAKFMWKRLQEAYFFCQRLNPDKLSGTDKTDYDEIVDSYNFYINRPNIIPCLWSNVPIWKEGKKSSKLTKAHLMQRKRLPFYSVLFNDEIGLQFKAKKGNNDKLDPLSELARFIRHYIDGYWDFTEQNVDKAFIDLRRVAGSNKNYNLQQWKLKPTLLLGLYNFIKDCAMYDMTMSKLYKNNTSQQVKHLKASKRASKNASPFLLWLKKLISCIGWRKYIYQELGNCEIDNKGFISSNIVKIYLPSCLNCKYDDRAYRNKYKPKKQSLEDSFFKGNILLQDDLNEIFGEE